eukprot:350228-Chlamydomonas_euryale.AAC.8
MLARGGIVTHALGATFNGSVFATRRDLVGDLADDSFVAHDPLSQLQGASHGGNSSDPRTAGA